jgi:hypothetical protein
MTWAREGSTMTPNGTAEASCDHVILALPFSTLRHIDCQQAWFDALKQTAIMQLGYGTISRRLSARQSEAELTQETFPPTPGAAEKPPSGKKAQR